MKTHTSRLLAALLLAASSLQAAPDQVPAGLSKADWQSIRHVFRATDTGWEASNKGQQWTTTFDDKGFITTPADKSWTWGLQLQSYGFGEAQQSITTKPTGKAEGTRLSYQWDSNVQEWWVNDERGLEHGFTLAQRPIIKGQTNLAITLHTRGPLTPRRQADAQGIDFTDAAGRTVITYAGLRVWDADGKVLPSHFAEVSGIGEVDALGVGLAAWGEGASGV
jgi:trimeric autotransporter adhesin